MINRAGPGPLWRSSHDAFQAIAITRRNASPMFIQVVDVAQLDSADRSLNFVEAEIVTNEVVHVFRFSAVIAQHPQVAGERRIAGRDATTVPHDSEILRWKKRKRARARNRADALAAILRAEGLGAIFYHPKPVFLRGQENSIHVGGMSVKMDRKNSDRA